MAIEPHVHCAVCHMPIATQTVDDFGTATPVEIHTGTAFKPFPGPDGSIGLARDERQPLCDSCFEQLATAQQRPRLLVPTGLAKPL